METTTFVLNDLGVAEVEPNIAAVQQHAGRLHPPHGLAHAVRPDRQRVRVALHPTVEVATVEWRGTPSKQKA